MRVVQKRSSKLINGMFIAHAPPSRDVCGSTSFPPCCQELLDGLRNGLGEHSVASRLIVETARLHPANRAVAVQVGCLGCAHIGDGLVQVQRMDTARGHDRLCRRVEAQHNGVAAVRRRCAGLALRDRRALPCGDEWSALAAGRHHRGGRQVQQLRLGLQQPIRDSTELLTVRLHAGGRVGQIVQAEIEGDRAV